ncbi:MAG: hypothetical protein KDA05_06700 [Phycisphaerales bacterium]|nr:hypothetical protein [Phycisphaerales bacterium]
MGFNVVQQSDWFRLESLAEAQWLMEAIRAEGWSIGLLSWTGPDAVAVLESLSIEHSPSVAPADGESAATWVLCVATREDSDGEIGITLVSTGHSVNVGLLPRASLNGSPAARVLTRPVDWRDVASVLQRTH